MAPAPRIHLRSDAPHIIDSNDDVDAYFVETFKTQFQVRIQELNEEEIVFDLIHIDASIANALRRILLAEIPTMAIEHVYIWNNSSIIQDEVLAHRLGLVPLKVDPRVFEDFLADDEEAEATDANTIVYKLDITCKADSEHPNDITKAKHAYVYSRDMEWIPQGDQQDRFDTIRPISDEILLAKLRIGQSIALEAHCRRGIGKDHAKFSPVSTASYRNLPDIQILQPITGRDAQALVQEKCRMGVFDIEDLAGESVAIVKNPRNCTMCRECIREPRWEEKIKLARQQDHFIFKVESVGMYKPQDLLLEALKILANKCANAIEAICVEKEASVLDDNGE